MELIQEVPSISAYLAADEVIDHQHLLVQETADRLRHGTTDAYTYARAAFEWVRDTIPHSADSGDPRVTWRASDVIGQRNGICYAKSHALAALLHAGFVPTAFCYQRLTEDDGSAPMVHGLIAVSLPERGTGRGVERRGWFRQDARGDKSGVSTAFSLREERLARPVRPECGEVDYPTLYAAPHPAVVEVLKAAPDSAFLLRTLPTAL